MKSSKFTGSAYTHDSPFVPPAWLMPSRVFISGPAFTSISFMLANWITIASLSRPENRVASLCAIREIYLSLEFCKYFSKKPTDSPCLYLLALRFCPFFCMILAPSLYCTLIPCTCVGESAILFWCQGEDNAEGIQYCLVERKLFLGFQHSDLDQWSLSQIPLHSSLGRLCLSCYCSVFLWCSQRTCGIPPVLVMPIFVVEGSVCNACVSLRPTMLA